METLWPWVTPCALSPATPVPAQAQACEPFAKNSVQVWAGREDETRGQPHGEGGRSCVGACGARESQREGSWCFSLREASVSMLTLCFSLLLLMGASERCPSQESFTSGSGEAMEFWHVSHPVCMWMPTHVYACEHES